MELITIREQGNYLHIMKGVSSFQISEKIEVKIERINGMYDLYIKGTLFSSSNSWQNFTREELDGRDWIEVPFLNENEFIEFMVTATSNQGGKISEILQGQTSEQEEQTAELEELNELTSEQIGILQDIKNNQLSVMTTVTDYLNFSESIPAALNSTVEITVNYGHNSMAFYIIPPTGGKVMFEGTPDGTNWAAITVREIGANGYTHQAATAAHFIGSISCMRKIRLKTITPGSAPGIITGKMVKGASTLEGAENNAAPHLFGYVPIHKDADFTGTQTGAAVWTPTSGKKFVVTDIIFSTGSVTGSVTFTLFDGTDIAGNRVMKLRTGSNSAISQRLKTPFVSAAAGNVLRYTSSGTAESTVLIHGYEID